MKKTIVINLFAGPGTGKSTFCAGIFAKLKWLDIDCEMALEYAKDAIWEGSLNKLDNQMYVFGKQQHRMFRLNGKVNIIVTDAPLINSIVYDAGNDKLFQKMILREFNKFDNMNIFLERKKKYNPNGRRQTFEQAKELDKQTQKMLDDNNVPYTKIKAIPENIDRIINMITRKLKERDVARKK